MGANTPARAATTDEKNKQRSEGQWSEFHLAIQPVNSVYTARINQTFDSYNNLVHLTVDGASGSLADVLPNMTVLIGSTPGGDDHGICRVRRAWNSTTAYIGMTSKIRPVNDDYVTVIDAMPIWARHPVYVGSQVYMDADIAFGDEPASPPVPALGPLVAVLRLAGATVDFTPPDPSDLSWSPDGASITSYLYTAPGASATLNMGTTQPTFTYNAPGWYRWSCTLTDASGRTYTGYRWVLVEPTDIDFVLEEKPIGDSSSGGWAFAVKCMSGVTLSDVRDRALVVLWTTDHFDGAEVSIGPIPGYENMLVWGWIDGQSIDHDPLRESVRFTVRGPAFWLGKIQAFPVNLNYSSGAAANWEQVQALTVDKALAHIFQWRSNLAQIMDCIAAGDTNNTPLLATPAANLWNQISTFAEKVFAKPKVNRFGQLFVEVDPQFKTTSARNAMPVVQEITKEDWIERQDISRVTQPTTCLLQLTATQDYDGVAEVTVHSLAPGDTPLEFGEPDAKQGYIVADQSDCNRQAGNMLASANNEYPSIPILFASRFVDICPAQWLTQSVVQADTARGIAFTLKRFVPRRVALNLSKANKVRWDVDIEAEAIGVDGIPYYPPIAAYDGLPDLSFDMDFPAFPGIGTWFPGIVTPPIDTGVEGDCASAGANGPFGMAFDRNYLDAVNDAEPIARCALTCIIRGGGTPTTINVAFVYHGDASGHVHVYALDAAGAIVATGSVAGGVITFAVGSPTEVAGFQIELDDTAIAIDHFLVGDPTQSGSVNGNDTNGIEITGLTPGEWYCIRSTGGPWRLYEGTLNNVTFDSLGGSFDSYDLDWDSVNRILHVANMQGNVWSTAFGSSCAGFSWQGTNVYWVVYLRTNSFNYHFVYPWGPNSDHLKVGFQSPAGVTPVGHQGPTWLMATPGLDGTYDGDYEVLVVKKFTTGPSMYTMLAGWIEAQANPEVFLNGNEMKVWINPSGDWYSFSLSLDGLVWEGALGRTIAGMSLLMPAWCTLAEDFDGNHAQVIFQASQSNVYFAVSERLADNTGSLGWELRPATPVSERALEINGPTIRNIC